MRTPLVPVDIVGLIKEGLLDDKRAPDGLLHASSNLVGSLRHTQLKLAGAPTLESPLVSDIRLRTGTMWHEYIHTLLRSAGVTHMSEVDVTQWMPEGWSGTLDWLIWHPKYQAWVVTDLKTSKGEAIKWRLQEGMSEEHWWQASAYYYAAQKMGLNLVKGVGVLYLPITEDLKEDSTDPIIIEAEPVPRQELLDRMSTVKKRTDEYIQYGEGNGWFEGYINEYLEPPQNRVQKLVWESKRRIWNVTLVPHWSADYCPFDNDLCDCSEQGTTKVGHWEYSESELRYTSRDGYDDVVPVVQPDKREVKRRLK